MYCLFDPSCTFVAFSVQNSGGRPIDHVVVMRCTVSQCWFVLLRQTWCTLVSGERFVSYGFHPCLVFLQSNTKFPSSLSYVTFLTARTWNFVYAICNFLLLLFMIWCTSSDSTGLIATRTWCFLITRAILSDVPSTSGRTTRRRFAESLFCFLFEGFISCHVASLSWQEPEEEVNILLLMKVSDRDRNVKR